MNQAKEEKPLRGEFMLPLIKDDTVESDPWQRNYNAPPKMHLVPRSYDIADIRGDWAFDDRGAIDRLQSHGFAVVKHYSPFVDKLLAQGDDNDNPDLESAAKAYHSQIQELVMRTTGARKVFVTATVVRRGSKTAQGLYQLPTGVRLIRGTKEGGGGGGTDCALTKAATAAPQPPQVAGTREKKISIALAAPIRTPHMDQTPLGARQTIRSASVELRDCAVASGIIAAEDGICKAHSVDATRPESDPPVAAAYNQPGCLGPRYASYSIWRPLKTVRRDPLCLAVPPVGLLLPPSDGRRRHPDLVFWPYHNKMRGPAELGGDFVKEFALCGVQHEEKKEREDEREGSGGRVIAAAVDKDDDDLRWYHISAQQPDEVLFVKLFDSAALGRHGTEVGAPFHASPEIGGEEIYPRESIELRVVAIW